jgi:hypothetical protein
MKKNFRFRTIFLFLLLVFTSAILNAQVTCPDANILWSEDFGTGTTATSSPDILTSGLFYQATGELASEGSYRIINNTQQKPEWQASPDHTGNGNGKMLVVNGQAEIFYQHTVTSLHGFVPGTYAVSLFLMNIDTAGICRPDPLLPVATFKVEYLSQSNTWVSLGGSPYTAEPVSQTTSPVWVNQGSSFTLPETGVFFPTEIRITVGDGTVGGCGNDFAMDDVSLSLCAEAAPTPVELINFTAHLAGNRVRLDWSTSQELNNNYFQIERSSNGNSTWSVLATVSGAGNSQVLKNYNFFDATPLSGANYYRLKQVDGDGNFKYSRIINIKIDRQKESVSVLANPFHNTLSVNFISAIPQVVSARLIDITGKQVALEEWVVNGNSTKDFANINKLQPGIYILTITKKSGEILYNNKVLKQ